MSLHFSLEELCHSDTARRLNIDNEPSPPVMRNLEELIVGLEYVRDVLGHPMLISSGYRCEALNKAIGGSKTSAHMAGYAADFTCPGFGSPAAVVKAIAVSPIHFDQCIFEGRWVHISFDPRGRRSVLTAHFGPGGATYTTGASITDLGLASAARPDLSQSFNASHKYFLAF